MSFIFEDSLNDLDFFNNNHKFSSNSSHDKNNEIIKYSNISFDSYQNKSKYEFEDSDKIFYNKFISSIKEQKWTEETKTRFIELFNEYYDNRKNHILLNDVDNNKIKLYNIDLSSLIDANNINFFLYEEKKFKNQTLDKYKRMFLKVIRYYFKDYSIKYFFNCNKIQEKKKKKVRLTNSSLMKLLKYLKNRFLFEELMIIELLLIYKINIGSISQIKNNNYIKKNSIIIQKKFNKIKVIKNKSTLRRLKSFIKKNKIEKEEYLFYNKTKGLPKIRANYVLKKFIKNIRQSNTLNIKEINKITTEVFRKFKITKHNKFNIQKTF